MHAALEIQYRYERGALRPMAFYCLFGLLSVSGMRLSEALNLELRDVDLAEGVLTIRGAKFGKDRLLPLHASTCKVLADYIVRRDRHWAGRDVSPYLFVSSWGGRLDPADVHRTFYALSRNVATETGDRSLFETHDGHGPSASGHSSFSDCAVARTSIGGNHADLCRSDTRNEGGSSC